MAETRLRRSNTCFIKGNRDGQKPAGPMSERGLEFLSWFKRSPRVGNGEASGLWWVHILTPLQPSCCPWHWQSQGITRCFALLLFLLTKRGCRQAGQSTSGSEMRCWDELRKGSRWEPACSPQLPACPAAPQPSPSPPTQLCKHMTSSFPFFSSGSSSPGRGRQSRPPAPPPSCVNLPPPRGGCKDPGDGG